MNNIYNMLILFKTNICDQLLCWDAYFSIIWESHSISQFQIHNGQFMVPLQLMERLSRVTTSRRSDLQISAFNMLSTKKEKPLDSSPPFHIMYKKKLLEHFDEIEQIYQLNKGLLSLRNIAESALRKHHNIHVFLCWKMKSLLKLERERKNREWK